VCVDTYIGLIMHIFIVSGEISLYDIWKYNNINHACS